MLKEGYWESEEGHEVFAGMGSGDGHSFDDQPCMMWIPDKSGWKHR